MAKFAVRKGTGTSWDVWLEDEKTDEKIKVKCFPWKHQAMAYVTKAKYSPTLIEVS